MNTDTRSTYLLQRFHRRSTAASVGRFLWHSVQIAPTLAAYMIYRLTDQVHRARTGSQRVIHIPVVYEIPVMYERRGEHAFRAA